MPPPISGSMPPCQRCGRTGVVTNGGVCRPCQQAEEREENERDD